MSAVSPLTGVTIEQYLSYEAPDGWNDELIDGEIVLSPASNRTHADIGARLYDLLKQILRGSRFVVRLDMSMRLEEQNSMPRPDVFVISRERWTENPDDLYPSGSPELSIEVFSPSNRSRKFQRKLELYLQTGSRAAWVVYPKAQMVRVHDGNGTRDFGSAERLELPTPLPPAVITVSDIFMPPD